MKCQKCNAINDDESKFCVNCGSPLEKSPSKSKKSLMTKKQLIFTLIAVIGIISLGAAVHYSNVLMGEPQLVDHDFQVISMSVPEGSNFVLKDHMTQNVQFGYIAFLNKGEYGYRASSVMIAQKSDTNVLMGDIIEENGDMKVASNTSDGEPLYQVQISKPDCNIILMGGDLNLLKKMADTIEVKDLSMIQIQPVQAVNV